MKMRFSITAGLSLILAGVSWAQTITTTSAPVSPRTMPAVGSGLLQNMTRVLELSPEQQAKITEVFKARAQAVLAWQDAHEKELQELQKAMTDAAGRNDADGVAQAAKQLAQLQAGLEQVVAESDSRLMEALTPEQRLRWQEHQAIVFVQTVFAKARLSEEQLAKARAAWAQTSGGKVIEDRADWRKALDALRGQVQAVLTPEQKGLTATARAPR